MSSQIRKVDYFYTMVPDQPGEAHRLLSDLADMQVRLLAFTAIPFGPSQTQLAIFPADSDQLRRAAEKAQFSLDGPHPAILVQGDDQLAELPRIHELLAQAAVNVYAATGVTSAGGEFGYLIYVRPEQYQVAVESLSV